MDLLSIILSIVMITLVSLLSFYFFYFFLKKNIFQKNNSILMFFEIDLKNWRVRKTPSLLESSTSNEINERFLRYFQKKIGKGWISITDFFKLLDSTNKKEKIQKAIEYCAQNKANIEISTEFVFDSFSTRKNKNLSFLFNLKFRYVDDNKINVECKNNEEIYNLSLKKKVISKEELISNKKKYKLFVAFALNDDKQETYILFLEKIYNLLKNNNFKFFKSNSILLLVLSSDSYSTIRKQGKRINKKLKKSLTKSNINNFYDAVTFVECSKLKSENDFSTVMIRISYALIKSRVQHETIFFNLNSIHMNEFNEFKEKLYLIKGVLNSKSIPYELIPVKSIMNKSHLYNFYVPRLNIEDDYWNSHLLKVNNYDLKIKDKFFLDTIKKNKQTKKHSFININDYQALEHFDLIKKNNDFTYVLNRVKFKDIKQFIRLINLFELSKIKYGLFVDEFDSEFYSIIKNIKPQVIVVSDKFNSYLVDGKIKSKIKIMSAIFITEYLNINLIFTNVDKQMQKEIHILSKTEKFFLDKPPHSLF